MDHDSVNLRLTKITTFWSVLQTARDDTPRGGRAAREQVLERYGGAVRRYLLGALRDPDAADDVFQEFAVQFLRGRLHGFDPQRGRFRDYLRGMLFRLVAEYHRKRKKQPEQSLTDALNSATAGTPDDGSMQDFFQSWRNELLLQSWKALYQAERDSGSPFYTLLRMRTEQPGTPSHVLAKQLSERCGKELQAANVRQLLKRAREKFSDVLLRLVVDSLPRATAGDLEQELIELGLLQQCRPALERWSHARTDSQ